MEQLFLDLHLNLPQVTCLGEHLMGYWLGLIRGFAAAGVDGIFFTDDWGSQQRLMISPQMWRQVFKPWYRRLFGEAHGLGLHTMLHTCGNVTAIVGDLIEVGLDILNPLQPLALDGPAIAAEYGDRLSFCGCIDVQQFLVESTPSEVDAGIRSIIDTFDGPQGGFIIAPANSIMPETPVENVRAMCRAMRLHSDRRMVAP
jgi:uroporphyrinogen decarboxylase